jgi:hypothetical protein
MQWLVTQFKISHTLFVVEPQCLKSLQYFNCPSYNKIAKIILLLQFLCSPVWWPYTESVINMDFTNGSVNVISRICRV